MTPSCDHSLFRASFDSHNHIQDYLIVAGADVNRDGVEGDRGLQTAARQNLMSCMKLLINCSRYSKLSRAVTRYCQMPPKPL